MSIRQSPFNIIVRFSILIMIKNMICLYSDNTCDICILKYTVKNVIKHILDSYLLREFHKKFNNNLIKVLIKNI